MMRKIAILSLVFIIVGASVAGVYLFQKQQQDAFLKNKMHMAEAMLANEDFDGAVKHLEPLLEAGKRYQDADRVLYLMALCQKKITPEAAYGFWEQLVEDYPDSKFFPEARLNQAQALLRSDSANARTIFQELKAASDSTIRSQAMMGVAKSFEMESQPEKAQALYEEMLKSGSEPEAVAAAKDYLTDVNSATLWSPVLDDFSQLYEVQRGDSPAKIGQMFKTTAWYVIEANKLGGSIRPGKRLKVPKEPFHIVVDKSNCRLNLMTASGKFIKWYPVGLGEQSYKTPAGDYTIKTKQIDPVWYKPSGGIIKAGEPDNALGTRWMGIGSSLGIHGTNEPDTIGFRKSAGCIRMYNQDAEELYKLVTYGTNVTIVEDADKKPSPAAGGAPQTKTAGTGESATETIETEPSSL